MSNLNRLEKVRKIIEKAVIEHCNGGDLWLSTKLAAVEVIELIQPEDDIDEDD